MRHCKCPLLAALMWVAVLTQAAEGRQCAGCWDDRCPICAPMAADRFIDPLELPFGVRPPAMFGTITFDVLGLERSRADAQDFLFDTDFQPVGNVSDLNFVTEAGFRLDLMLPGDGGCDLNLSFLTTGHDSATITSDAPGVTFVWYDAGPLVPAASYTAEYSSEFFSGELNFRTRNQWPRLLPLAGIRIGKLEEEFNIWETDTGTGYYSTVKNQLFGVQVGAQALVWRYGCVRFESSGKVGAYYNHINLEAQASNASIQQEFDHTAFVGELQFGFVYQHSPRVALRGGYQGLWVSGVGLAPDQSANGSFATNVVALDTGHVSYQGGYLGAELTW